MVQIREPDGSSAVVGGTEPIIALWPLHDGGLLVGNVHGGLHRWSRGDVALVALPLNVDADALWTNCARIVSRDVVLSFVSADVVIQQLPDCTTDEH